MMSFMASCAIWGSGYLSQVTYHSLHGCVCKNVDVVDSGIRLEVHYHNRETHGTATANIVDTGVI